MTSSPYAQCPERVVINYTLSADRTRCDITPVMAVHYVRRAPGNCFSNAGNRDAPVSGSAWQSLGQNEIVLTGEPRMKERPIGHLADSLRQGGRILITRSRKNYPPLMSARRFYRRRD